MQNEESYELIKQLYNIIMDYEGEHPGTIDRIESENGDEGIFDDIGEEEEVYENKSEQPHKQVKESYDAQSVDEENSQSWLKAFGNVKQFTKPLSFDSDNA